MNCDDCKRSIMNCNCDLPGMAPKDRYREPAVVEIGYHEIMEIKHLAHQQLLQAPVPKSAVDDPRTWYLFEALGRFLETKGVKPNFKVKQ